MTYPDLGSASNWLKQIFHASRPVRGTTQIWEASCISMEFLHVVASQNVGCLQWRIQERGPGGPTPLPLFLDQTEARRAEIFFVLDPPPPLSRGQGDRALPYLKVRICSYGAQPLVKSFCKTLLKSLFWALTCVPRVLNRFLSRR